MPSVDGWFDEKATWNLETILMTGNSHTLIPDVIKEPIFGGKKVPYKLLSL